MDNDQIRREFEKIWEKLNEFESKISEEREITAKNQIKKKKTYNGLAGGIRMLIDNGFLAIPKTVKEVHEELKREGYHYSYASTDKLMRVDLHKRTKVLNRVKDGKTWSYVVRK